MHHRSLQSLGFVRYLIRRFYSFLVSSFYNLYVLLQGIIIIKLNTANTRNKKINQVAE